MTGRGLRWAPRGLTGVTTAVLVGAAACGGKDKADGGGGQGGGETGGGGKRPVAVQVSVAEPRTVAETREVTGTLAAAREARLVAQLEGAVTRVLVDEGDRVRAGQLLATFDNSVQAAELAGARTRARVARAASERAGRLLTLGAGSRAEQEEAAATLREAVGALRGAEARAAYGEVRAPFAGLVTAVRVNAGDVVGARQEVAVVADASELRVEVPVSELDVVRLSPGDPVPVTVDALPGRTFAGRVSRIYPTVDAATRQGIVEVALRRGAPELRAGLLARLTLTVARAERALAVPLDAVRRDVRDQPYVYVVQDVFVREPADAGGAKGKGDSNGEEKGESKGDAQGGEKGASGDEARKRSTGGEADTVVRRAQIVLRRPVRVGLRGGDNYVQLAEGVRRGDRVVVTGDQELSDSARVRVLPTREAGGDATGRAVATGGGDGQGEAAGNAAADGVAGPASASGDAPNGSAANGSAANGSAAAEGATGHAASGGVASGSVVSGARSAAAAGAQAGASGATAPGAARTPGAVGGVGAAAGGGLSGGASASTGVPARGGRGTATGGRTGARAGGMGRASGAAGAGTGAGGPGGGDGGG